MAGIRQPLEDVLNRIRTDLTQFQTVRVWNNQIEMEHAGKYQAYAKPACFVEILNDVVWGQLAEGYSSADLGYRFHIVHEFYDAQDGTYEQDLVVFGLRDDLIANMMLFQPTGCGHLTKINEIMDYDHENVYHMIIDFVCHFIDDKGVKQQITKNPPTDINLTATFTTPKNYLIT